MIILKLILVYRLYRLYICDRLFPGMIYGISLERSCTAGISQVRYIIYTHITTDYSCIYLLICVDANFCVCYDIVYAWYMYIYSPYV